eukprot:6167852-Pleurochrysis_carterae.AAC.1
MATDPVTRQLAFNAMSPQLGARRPTVPYGQVALHYVHLAIFAQRLHPTNQTLDGNIWIATLEDNWGVDLWPALFTQAGDFDVSTMGYLGELLRSQLLQNIQVDASVVDVSRT